MPEGTFAPLFERLFYGGPHSHRRPRKKAVLFADDAQVNRAGRYLQQIRRTTSGERRAWKLAAFGERLQDEGTAIDFDGIVEPVNPIFPFTVRCESDAFLKKARKFENLAGTCEKPVWGILMHTGQNAKLENLSATMVHVHVPCRKCRECLRMKASHWVNRAEIMTELGSYTWWCTFTWDTDTIPVKLVEAGDIVERPAVTLMEKLVGANQEFTRYIDRLRHLKRKPQFKYLMVIELTKRGRPHIHVLLHELGTKAQHLRETDLSDQWTAGQIDHIRGVSLADASDRASYLVKYMFKPTPDMHLRVRASVGYGDEPTDATLFGLPQDEPDHLAASMVTYVAGLCSHGTDGGATPDKTGCATKSSDLCTVSQGVASQDYCAPKATRPKTGPVAMAQPGRSMPRGYFLGRGKESDRAIERLEHAARLRRKANEVAARFKRAVQEAFAEQFSFHPWKSLADLIASPLTPAAIKKLNEAVRLGVTMTVSEDNHGTAGAGPYPKSA